jgi:drug/metabolite transporter (DMT)-like permease
MSSIAKGSISLFFAAFAYGFYGIFSRYLGSSFDLYFQFWTRYIIIIVVVLIPILFGRSWKHIEKTDWVWFVLRSFIGSGAAIGIFYVFNHLEIGTTYFIFYAGSTIFGYIIGGLIFKEKLTKAKATSLALSMVGLFLIYTVNFELSRAILMLLALTCGCGIAVWNTFSKKVSNRYSTSQIVLIDMGISFLILVILSFALNEKWVMPELSMAWFFNVLFALILLAESYLMIYGFNRLEAQIGSLIMLAEVPFAIFFSYLFYHELVSVTTYIGGMVIMIATIIPEFKLQYSDNVIK